MSLPGVSVDQVRELILANRILANEGVMDAFGHVSVRHPERADQFVIARSIAPELVSEGDLQVYDLDGAQMGGNAGSGYAERAIHAAIYASRPDVYSVCHNHSPSVIPFGITDVPLRPLFHMAALLGTDVPTWDIAAEFGDTDLLVHTPQQAESLARALGGRRVVLMRGHGSVVAGASVREVVTCCVYTEHNARLLLRALELGRPIRYLSPGECESASRMVTSQLVAERAWSTWAARVE